MCKGLQHLAKNVINRKRLTSVQRYFEIRKTVFLLPESGTLTICINKCVVVNVLLLLVLV